MSNSAGRVHGVVLGASGLIGSHLLSVAAERGISALGTSFRQHVPGLRSIDITNAASVDELLRDARAESLFLTAANSNVDYCETRARETREINVAAVQTVAETACRLGVLLIYYSTDYVFDGLKGPYGEMDVPNPISEYGRQKLDAENIVRRVMPHNHLILRVTVVYGWERQGKNFVARLVENLRGGRSVRVPNDQFGTPTLADDIADASWELSLSGARGTYHLAGPDLVDRCTFARAVANQFGLDADLIRGVPTSELGQTAARPLRAGMRSDRAAEVLGHGLRGIVAGIDTMLAQQAKSA